MNTLFIYTKSCIKYDFRGKPSGYSMTITSMLKPDVFVLDDTMSKNDICNLIRQNKQTYNAINMVIDETLFRSLITPLKRLIDESHQCHVFVVNSSESLHLDTTYNNVTVSFYEDFHHLLAVLALQVSDYYINIKNYKLGYFHAFLAKKYLEAFDKSVFFNPAIHFKIAYAYKQLNDMRLTKTHLLEALSYTAVIFNTYGFIDIGLTLHYLKIIIDDNIHFDVVKKYLIDVLKILDTVRSEMTQVQALSLAAIYENLLMCFSWDDAAKVDLLNKEFYIRQGYLEDNNWKNRLRFAIICKTIGDYNQLNGEAVKAHYMYLTSLSLFHFAYRNKKTDSETVELLLETINVFYDKHTTIPENAIVLSIKNDYS